MLSDWKLDASSRRLMGLTENGGPKKDDQIKTMIEKCI